MTFASLLVNLTILFTTKPIFDKNTILNFFEYFSNYLQSALLIAKSINAESISPRGTYIKNIFINSVDAIEYSEMYLQFF